MARHPVPDAANASPLHADACGWLLRRRWLRCAQQSASRGCEPGTGAAPGLQLMTAVSGTELLAHVRALVNDVRQDRFGEEYSVTSSPGLSARYDSMVAAPDNWQRRNL